MSIGHSDTLSTETLSLVSDAEREAAARVLNTAFCDGRLDDDDHEERAERVQHAHQRADLDMALRGIPTTTALITAQQPTLRHDPDADPSGELSRAAPPTTAAERRRGWLTVLCVVLTAMFVILSLWMGQADRENAFKEEDALAAKEIAPAQRWLTSVEEAEHDVRRATGRYTDDRASLTVAQPNIREADLVDVDGYIQLAERGTGVILGVQTSGGVKMTSIIDADGKVTRRCSPGPESVPSVLPPSARCPAGWATPKSPQSTR